MVWARKAWAKPSPTPHVICTFIRIKMGGEWMASTRGDFAMLWLVSYIFLLRVPSEALPMRRGGDGFIPPAREQSVLLLEDSATLCLVLHRRKNKPEGSVLRRTCACAACPEVCPVHRLWHGYFKALAPGAQPWSAVSPDQARTHLRASLAALRVSSLLRSR